MTAAVKHMARKQPGATGTLAPAQPRNSQLRERFPARPAQAWWPCTAEGEEDTLRRLTSPPFLPEIKETRAGRRRGTAKMLRWLSSFPGVPGSSGGKRQALRTARAARGCNCRWTGCASTGRRPPTTRTTCRRGC